MSGLQVLGLSIEPEKNPTEPYVGGNESYDKRLLDDIIRSFLTAAQAVYSRTEGSIFAKELRCQLTGRDYEIFQKEVPELLNSNPDLDPQEFLDASLLRFWELAPKNAHPSLHFYNHVVQMLYDTGHDNLLLNLRAYNINSHYVGSDLKGTEERPLRLVVDPPKGGYHVRQVGHYAQYCSIDVLGPAESVGADSYGCYFTLEENIKEIGEGVKKSVFRFPGVESVNMQLRSTDDPGTREPKKRLRNLMPDVFWEVTLTRVNGTTHTFECPYMFFPNGNRLHYSRGNTRWRSKRPLS